MHRENILGSGLASALSSMLLRVLMAAAFHYHCLVAVPRVQRLQAPRFSGYDGACVSAAAGPWASSTEPGPCSWLVEGVLFAGDCVSA